MTMIKTLGILSYSSIIFASIGMILFATKFPFSTSIWQLKYAKERVLWLNGCQLWVISWFLVILGTTIQLFLFLYEIDIATK